jgi:ABC-type branched-subunit amino acid transport system substrate-binding protein
MAQVMHAHFQEINKRGGIFGRKLELLAIPYGSSAEATLDNLRSAFEKEGVFALVGAYTVGLDGQILELLRGQKMPMVGPFTLNPGDAFVDADVFYIYPGFTEQAQALAAKAIAMMKGGAGTLVLVGPEDENVDGLIAAVEQNQSKDKPSRIETLRYQRGELDAAALAQSLQQAESDAVVFFGVQAELEALLNGLDGIKHYPGIFALSAFVPRPLAEAPAMLTQRIYLAYPTLSTDVSEAGRNEYLKLAKAHALPPSHLQSQIAALAAAKLLEEGLRAAGRTLNRERLVEAIEALYRYDTGLTPPLTYGPNRRIGAKGAHVMKVGIADKASAPVGTWHEVR